MLTYLDRQYFAIFLIVGLAWKLAMRKRDARDDTNYFWLTILCVAVLTVVNTLESFAAESADLRFWRILFSVVGYALRPVAALSLAMAVAKRRKANSLLWIPAIVNALIMCTAFFTDVAFGFDANYGFHRGPLGYSVFVVGILYLLLIFVFTYQRFRQGHPWERRVLYLCGLLTLLGVYLDVEAGGEHLNTAIMVSAVFFYMFLRTQDSNRDGMTKLLNRQSNLRDYP